MRGYPGERVTGKRHVLVALDDVPEVANVSVKVHLHEMDEVIATLDTLAVDAIMSKATKAKLHWVTGLGLKAHFKGVPPKEYHQIFAALDGKR